MKDLFSWGGGGCAQPILGWENGKTGIGKTVMEIVSWSVEEGIFRDGVKLKAHTLFKKLDFKKLYPIHRIHKWRLTF